MLPLPLGRPLPRFWLSPAADLAADQAMIAGSSRAARAHRGRHLRVCFTTELGGVYSFVQAMTSR